MIKSNDKSDSRLGRCYELSYKLATSKINSVLVHGYIKDKHGRIIDHAWVEIGDTVYECVLDKTCSKEVYYRIIAVEVSKVYTFDETIEMSLKHRTYGPWHEVKNCIWWEV